MKPRPQSGDYTKRSVLAAAYKIDSDHKPNRPKSSSAVGRARQIIQDSRSVDGDYHYDGIIDSDQVSLFVDYMSFSVG